MQRHKVSPNTHIGIKRQSCVKKTDTFSFHGDHSCPFATALRWFDNWGWGGLIAWDIRSLARRGVDHVKEHCFLFAILLIQSVASVHCTLCYMWLYFFVFFFPFGTVSCMHSNSLHNIVVYTIQRCCSGKKSRLKFFISIYLQLRWIHKLADFC